MSHLAPNAIGSHRQELSKPLMVSANVLKEKAFCERLQVPSQHKSSVSRGAMMTLPWSRVLRASSAVLPLSAPCHVQVRYLKGAAEPRKEKWGSSRLQCCNLTGFSWSSHFFSTEQSPDCYKLKRVFRVLRILIPF